MKEPYARQGDLVFNKTKDSVDGKSHQNLTIALGEQTGHSHQLIAQAGSEIVGDNTKFEVKGKAKLIHPEHDTIEFNSGVYVVINEREFDYVEEAMRQVVD